MKNKIFLAVALAALVALAGCQTPVNETPAPDIATAPSSVQAKYTSVMKPFGNLNTLVKTPPKGVGVTVRTNTDTQVDVTVTFTQYPDDGSVYNGSFTITGTNSTDKMTIRIVGSVVVSGAKSGNVAIAMDIVMTSTAFTNKGTITIDGVTYSVNRTQNL